jgi:apolipoprotein N-acyltransferase
MLPLFKPDFLSMEIPVYREKYLTPYTLYGDYVPYLLGCIIFAAALFNTLSCYITVRKLYKLPKSAYRKVR